MKPTVAVVGASSDRRKFGNKAVRAYLAAGYEVFPVHPTETSVEGQTVYRSVKDVPGETLDRIADAHRALEAGGVRGKHVVRIG